MPFYIWKLNDRIVAHKDSPTFCPPPAIEVTRKEFEDLGFSPVVYGGGGGGGEEHVSPTLSALIEGINSV